MYAALKAPVGLGITDVAVFARLEERFGSLGSLATCGTVVPALVAAAPLLALVEPWGRRLLRRPLRIAAWAGAAVLAVPGFAGLAESLMTYAGPAGSHDNGMASGSSSSSTARSPC